MSVTLAPARASRIGVARPLPMPSAREPAPVTIATLPASRRTSSAINLPPSAGRRRVDAAWPFDANVAQR
jgi:hypothetical protein